MKQKNVIQFVLVLAVVLVAANVFAAGSGMPWEGPMQKILDSFSGPVAKILGVLCIVGSGLAIAFGEGGAGMKKMLQIVFGLSIAFTATSFGISFFGFSGGVLF